MIDDRPLGRHQPLFVIAGPCVIESRNDAMAIARRLAKVANSLDLLLIFKASFDKANRTSESSYRGPGLGEGLDILAEIRSETELPILTDVHSPEQVPQVADVADVNVCQDWQLSFRADFRQDIQPLAQSRTTIR
jgi:2-dehydro-3-deoxyphosphooctonate aldolase (KDO 8-P synthase)